MLIETLLTANLICSADQYRRVIVDNDGQVISQQCVTEFWDCPVGLEMSKFQISADGNGDYYYCRPEDGLIPDRDDKT
jgi:hypothetical protein